jgi:Uma2 family endonuclease
MIAEPVERTESIAVSKRQFTVEEFERLYEAGVLANNERVELIWGEIAQMSPVNIAHSSCVLRLTHLLTRLLNDRGIIGVQNPVQLDAKTLPQPDVAVLRPRPDYYNTAHPGPGDIYLIIEVADSSLDYDRKTKSMVYARYGIADYWIVNLPGRQIEVHREPREDAYRTTTRYSRGDTLALLTFPDVMLLADDILG